MFFVVQQHKLISILNGHDKAANQLKTNFNSPLSVSLIVGRDNTVQNPLSVNDRNGLIGKPL